MSYKRTAKSKWKDRNTNPTTVVVGNAEIRLQPAILRRKRKAESDFEIPFSPESENHSFTDQCTSEESLASTDILSSPRPIVPFSSPSLISPQTGTSDSQIICWFRIPSNAFPTPEVTPSHSPLPKFSWAHPGDVWRLMVEKDSLYLRNHNYMSRHPALHAKMRSILLDWLMEVCEVYALHRATFYLCQDFIDRYLATQTDVPKQQLQLLGITCLFISAKIEEIYPPKISEFAFVTDGACSESDIIEKELVILKILNWDLTPMTINSWLNVYMQLVTIPIKNGETQDNFIFPGYSQETFAHVSEVLDLCILDIRCLQFTYGVVAVSALVHVTSYQEALSATGFKWADISSCVSFLAPFYETIREKGFVEIMEFKNVKKSDCHYIQNHSVDLELLEKAQTKVVKYREPIIVNQSAPCHLASTPRSTKKLRKTPHEIMGPEIIQLD